MLIGSVDCTSDDSKELCEKYGVSGYPTLKYFKVSPMGLWSSWINIFLHSCNIDFIHLLFPTLNHLRMEIPRARPTMVREV